ncbi:DUF2846 domain-containing protein [Pseudomonas sp. RL_15y_Pfl2_60]|uniref:DUF2846 domain-containing protein n=1 Tax=Pseudomonas sp. RL_15y_Pfl2_60 TaxID=3088709 RepID=UPI0030DAE658
MRCLPILFMPICFGLGACSSTLGGFFADTQGPAFTAQQATAPERAIVYLYRPKSAWADQELEAPGVFVNDQLQGSLPSNGYLAFETDPAHFQLELRRPLLGSYWTWLAGGSFDFVSIAKFTLTSEAGSRYFFRYDELNPPPGKSPEPAIGDGPVQQVSAEVALTEIIHTRQLQPLRTITPTAPEPDFWSESVRYLGF